MTLDCTNENLLLLTDSYKVGHWPQYPPGTTNVYSYFESRGGPYPGTVFFGLQYLLEKYLKPITKMDILEAKELYAAHFGSPKLFNEAGWEYIRDFHEGRLPLRIKAVPEGTLVPASNVLMTVENTDPRVPWLTNYMETLLSQVWYPSTVASISYFVRQMILKYLKETGTPEAIDFKLHDFGFRGVSSVESAGIGGAAHLTSFMGTDTVAALVTAKRYYDAPMAGFAVPASEHSTMTSWGRENEVTAFRNMIAQYGHMPFYSVVSDSYDIFEACRQLWGTVLKEQVLAAPGTLVVRPDSGDPVETTEKVLEILGEKFGKERNSKGYFVLNPKVRMIWGDGLEPKTIERILFRMKLKDWSADNIVFGMGGGLLQKVNRDTMNFAFKASSVTVDGVERNVMKSPIGQAMKKSKAGRLALINDVRGELTTVPEKTTDPEENLLETVFENGWITKKQTFEDVRKNTGMVAR